MSESQEGVLSQSERIAQPTTGEDILNGKETREEREQKLQANYEATVEFNSRLCERAKQLGAIVVSNEEHPERDPNLHIRFSEGDGAIDLHFRYGILEDNYCFGKKPDFFKDFVIRLGGPFYTRISFAGKKYEGWIPE